MKRVVPQWRTSAGCYVDRSLSFEVYLAQGTRLGCIADQSMLVGYYESRYSSMLSPTRARN